MARGSMRMWAAGRATSGTTAGSLAVGVASSTAPRLRVALSTPVTLTFDGSQGDEATSSANERFVKPSRPSSTDNQVGRLASPTYARWLVQVLTDGSATTPARTG